MRTGYLALGSNLENPIKQVLTAAHHLAQLGVLYDLQLSNLYWSPPFGPVEQPDFVNAVVGFQTALSPEELVNLAKDLEKKMHREKAQRWGPRIIDVDVLMLGQERRDTNALMLPHPGLLERDFVLQPLYDIAPALILPNGQAIDQWLATREPLQVERITPQEIEHVSHHLIHTEAV